MSEPKSLLYLPEPLLLFRHDQEMEDPRDGLTLLGPYDSAQNYGVKYGVVGTKDGIRRLKAWVAKIQGPVCEPGMFRKRPPFPGFEAAFGIPWSPTPLTQIEFDEEALRKKVMLDDRHKRTHEAVGFITYRILRALKEEEARPDVWIIVLPEFVYQYCRPKSTVALAIREQATGTMKAVDAQKSVASPFLFDQYNTDAEAYLYEPDFHNQLKGRLLKDGVLTQLIREGTIAHRDFLKSNGKPLRQLDNLQSQIAWNLSSAVYYKIGGRPWKLNGVREGVCYVGLVFKQDQKHPNSETACCAAQMFLDSGDGVVFKGNVGPWYTPKTGEFHLKPDAAKQLLGQALQSYREKHDGKAPKEVFIHGKTRFNDDEWQGFKAAAGTESELVGVRIYEADRFRLYRQNGKMPMLRGLAWVQNDRSAMLMTRGYVPRLATYPGMEVPKPLEIEICQGTTDIRQVLQDLLGLTKLNYNSCRYADGLPVTLKFADVVGEVLISGPNTVNAPLAFKHYI
jgi:hypothetical protein